jgi:phospholipase C
MLPRIEHVLVVMMENHSFDNYLGTLGRGDGFDLDHRGRPRNTNPYEDGKRLRAFHMPSACQLDREPSQAWGASHQSLGRGNNDGFVAACGPVAMGYFDEHDIPFYRGLAKTFPICDRWFGSCLGQTYPNRKYLFAGTSSGQVSTDLTQIGKAPPANGTIFERLNAHGIEWRDYATDLPSVALFPPVASANTDKIKKIDDFFADAKTGKLPGFAMVEPSYVVSESEENPQDVRKGEAFMARVVNAVLESPAWERTMLIWTYDEHGGYYDHVVPPHAIAPDDVLADVPAGQPNRFDQYGFRVPAAIVSPFARKRYVSHAVHDHTSVLKLIETKWNIGALTYRDANADNLLDSLDLHTKRPAFIEPPKLPKPALERRSAPACVEGSPGAIPPPSAIIPAHP